MGVAMAHNQHQHHQHHQHQHSSHEPARHAHSLMPQLPAGAPRPHAPHKAAAELASMLNHELSMASCEAQLNSFTVSETSRTDSWRSEGCSVALLQLLDDGVAAPDIEAVMQEELAAVTAEAAKHARMHADKEQRR